MSVRGSRSSVVKRQMKRRLYGARKIAPCCFCLRPLSFANATLEHVVPLSEGGRWDQTNLRISCDSCNQERGTKDFETFRTMKRASIRFNKS